MKNMKRFIALGLSAVMLVTMAACGNQESSQTGETDKQVEETGKAGEAVQEESEEAAAEEAIEWLNSDGSLPIVAEGTEKTLTMLVQRESGLGTEAEDTWFYHFIEEVMNINLEVTTFSADSLNETISLTFAGGDLPDIIVGGGFSAGDLVRYGVVEEQLTDMSPYMNETYMPNISTIVSKYPSVANTWTDTEGHVWSFGFVNDFDDPSQGMKFAMINYDWLEQCNMEVPTTLDEFYDMAVAFKALGEEIYGEEIYPIGGCLNGVNPLMYILNAFGYLNVDDGYEITYRNGEVVLPVADREVYGEVLKFVNKLYTERLIHPDFFTMDKETSNAIIAEGKVGFIPDGTFAYFNMENGGLDWWGALPLTSEYNETQQWPVTGLTTLGNVVVTSACEEPELAAAFIDWFYSYHNYNTAQQGFVYGYDPAEWGLGFYEGRKMAEFHDGEAGIVGTDAVSGEDRNKWLNENGRLFLNANIGTTMDLDYWMPEGAKEIHYKSRPYVYAYMDYSESDARGDVLGLISDTWCQSCLALSKTLGQYKNYDTVGSVYMDAETTTALIDIQTSIKEYAKQETAKFIIGTRSLDTLDAYFDDLEALGASEYVQKYAEVLGK